MRCRYCDFEGTKAKVLEHLDTEDNNHDTSVSFEDAWQSALTFVTEGGDPEGEAWSVGCNDSGERVVAAFEGGVGRLWIDDFLVVGAVSFKPNMDTGRLGLHLIVSDYERMIAWAAVLWHAGRLVVLNFDSTTGASLRELSGLVVEDEDEDDSRRLRWADCKRCGHRIGSLSGSHWWCHTDADGAVMRAGGRGCRAASYGRDGTWDDSLPRQWRAEPEPGTISDRP